MTQDACKKKCPFSTLYYKGIFYNILAKFAQGDVRTGHGGTKEGPYEYTQIYTYTNSY